jgi:hypothetical protein
MTTAKTKTFTFTTAKTKTFTLASGPMVHTPGLIRWAMAGYRTGAADTMIEIITSGWPMLTEEHARGLLSGDVPHDVIDDTVVFTVEAN